MFAYQPCSRTGLKHSGLFRISSSKYAEISRHLSTCAANPDVPYTKIMVIFRLIILKITFAFHPNQSLNASGRLPH